MADSDARTNAAAGEFVITRIFDAPPSLVFRAWTDPEHVKRWWGPNGFTMPFCTIDLRVGGVFHYCMRSPDGQDYWGKGVYREIVEPERLVFTDTFSDEAGNVVPPTHYGMSADWPTETLVTVTFEDHDGKTKLTLRSPLGTAPQAEREGAQQGWSESLDRLAQVLRQ